MTLLTNSVPTFSFDKNQIKFTFFWKCFDVILMLMFLLPESEQRSFKGGKWQGYIKCCMREGSSINIEVKIPNDELANYKTLLKATPMVFISIFLFNISS